MSTPSQKTEEPGPVLLLPYAYDRGEHRRKHCWGKDFPGFVPSGRGPIGKCPSSLKNAQAEVLLKQGIAYFDDPEALFPDTIYNVYQGIPYEAVVTEPGTSYHGYPWCGTMPPSIFEALKERAREEGFHKQFNKWCQNHSKMHK